MKKSSVLEKLYHLKKNAALRQLNLPKSIKIFEVGPRDGLQNETQILETEFKVKMIEGLRKAGLTNIEIGAFVSPKAIPQMADTQEVISKLDVSTKKCNYSVLVPNIKGLELAIAKKINEVAVFTAVSESFCKKNINCTIEESLKRFEPIFKVSKAKGIKVRGYVSCVLGCPYGEAIDPHKVNELTNTLLDMGCYEVSLGDTIGIGTPETTVKLLSKITAPKDKIAMHFHDTYGNALENILVSIEMGFSIIDSSVGGLGGCPYAKTVVGNVCTENVVQMMDYLDIHTGVDISTLKLVSQNIREVLKREVQYLFE